MESDAIQIVKTLRLFHYENYSYCNNVSLITFLGFSHHKSQQAIKFG